MISEDDQFHHLEERIGPRESEAGLNIYHEATLGLQFFNFFSSFKQVCIYI